MMTPDPGLALQRLLREYPHYPFWYILEAWTRNMTPPDLDIYYRSLDNPHPLTLQSNYEY